MWVVAFFGAATAYAESTLAQIYKEEDNNEFRGGPAYYIEKAASVSRGVAKGGAQGATAPPLRVENLPRL